MRQIRVAVCGDLPTAKNYLLSLGVVQIDCYNDATEIKQESDYHLLLVYAPQAEGLLNVVYNGRIQEREDTVIPIRLLNEPCCHSALLELKSTVKQIEKQLMTESSHGFSTRMKGQVSI
jgi:hypothetical protein